MPAYKDSKTGKWYCQFYYEDWKGQRKHKVKRGFERKKDALKYETDFKARTQTDVVTIERLVAGYKAHLESQEELGVIKKSSRINYCFIIDTYISPYFAGVNMEKVKTAHVNKFISELKRKDGKSLSASMKSAVKVRLKLMYQFAMNNYGLTENPVANTETIKAAKKKPTDVARSKFMSREDYDMLYDAVKDKYKLALNIMYWTGLRIGETLALTPADIKPYSITVSKTYISIRNEKFLDTPKSGSSIRTVEIPKFLYNEIAEYIEKMYDKDARLFNYPPVSLQHTIRTMCERLGIERVTPHVLRHSYASNLFNITKDPTVVSKQIGHSNPKITMQVYSHMLPGENRRAVDAMELLLADKKED